MSLFISVYESRVIQLCADYAGVAHSRQFRKDKVTPYIVHPARVAYLIAKKLYGYDGFIATCAAWLHDVIEDCVVMGTRGEIIQNHEGLNADIRYFLLENQTIKTEDGAKIFLLTKLLTMSQDKTISKQKRREEYLNRMVRLDPVAVMVKYCDRIDNLITVHHFSQGGFRWYIKDTEFLIRKLGKTVLEKSPDLHLLLNDVLEDSRKVYEVLYENK